MSTVAATIQDQFDVLLDEYDRRLQKHPAYAAMPAPFRREAARRTLNFVVDWLQSGDDTQLIQFIQATAQPSSTLYYTRLSPKSAGSRVWMASASSWDLVPLTRRWARMRFHRSRLMATATESAQKVLSKMSQPKQIDSLVETVANQTAPALENARPA